MEVANRGVGRVGRGRVVIGLERVGRVLAESVAKGVGSGGKGQ